MDIRKYCSCSPKTVTIAMGYYCMIMYACALSVTIYLQVVSTTKDDILISLNILLPIMLIFISLLLYGVYKRRPNFMLPWLVTKFLSLVVLTIFLVILCGTTLVSLIQKHFSLFVPFLVCLIAIGKFWYIHLVVYRYYKHLTEDPPMSSEDLKTSIITK